MRLSIISINRNNSGGLKLTIDSVLAQSIQDFEYIIIDGSSDDGSVDVVKDAASKREIKWISEPDSGIYNAMNKGAALANGDYMLFLNSGDTLANPDVIKYLQAEQSTADIIVGRINFTDGNGIVHMDYQKHGDCKSLYGFLDSMIPHQATLIRHSTFLSIGPYEEKYKIVADWQFCLKAAIVGASFGFVPVTISNFDNTGISSSENERMMQEIAKAKADTLPSVISNDYNWAYEHKGDVERIKWLNDHKGFHKCFKALVTLGKRFCR